jgi:hypothetical protein
MDLANRRAATRPALGLALLVLANVWIGAHGSPQATDAAAGYGLEFLHSAAGIDGRIQIIRRMEKAMLANAAVPWKAIDYRQKRDQARQRIDELMLQASAAAASDGERSRLEQLAMITRRADARYVQIASSYIQPKGDMR